VIEAFNETLKEKLGKREETMARLFFSMGPFAWPLMIIAIANIVMIVWRASQVIGDSPKPGPAVEAGINAILFWGVMALLLGYLGQYSGLYRGLSVIARAPAINPGMVALGIAESITTTIFGLMILAFSSIAWFLLRSRYRKLTQNADHLGSAASPAAA